MGGDARLGEAILAAGGVTELAREAATGVARSVLRPNLYANASDAFDDSAVARSQEYALLAALLARPPDAALLERLVRIESDGTPLGLVHGALARAAAEKDAAAVAREYFDLFIGVGRGELLPYGSYYLTGFLHERPLARLRADLADLGVERVEGQCEPEDHAAILCEIMVGLVAGEFAAVVERQRNFFDRHLAPWMAWFFGDLEAAKAADFYRPVGAIGRLFIDIETQAFALPG
jgi:TorA maturation chaperone TorD